MTRALIWLAVAWAAGCKSSPVPDPVEPEAPWAAPRPEPPSLAAPAKCAPPPAPPPLDAKRVDPAPGAFVSKLRLRLGHGAGRLADGHPRVADPLPITIEPHGAFVGPVQFVLTLERPDGSIAWLRQRAPSVQQPACIDPLTGQGACTGDFRTPFLSFPPLAVTMKGPAPVLPVPGRYTLSLISEDGRAHADPITFEVHDNELYDQLRVRCFDGLALRSATRNGDMVVGYFDDTTTDVKPNPRIFVRIETNDTALVARMSNQRVLPNIRGNVTMEFGPTVTAFEDPHQSDHFGIRWVSNTTAIGIKSFGVPRERVKRFVLHYLEVYPSTQPREKP